MTIMNGSSDIGLDDSTRNLSLREKKRLQWEKERNESAEWYPFGTPGGGNPLRPPRKSRSLSGANITTSPQVATGSNGPSSSGSPSSGTNNNNVVGGPLPPLQAQYHLVSSLQHGYTLPTGQPATYAYPAFANPQHAQNGYDTLLATPQLIPPGYMYSPQPGSPYLQQYSVPNNLQFPMQNNQIQLAAPAHPSDPGSPLPPRSNITLQPLVGPTTSTPVHHGASAPPPHPGVSPAGSFAHDGSYTEQWANQLEHWQAPPPDTLQNGQTSHVPKSRHASNAQASSMVSNYTMPASIQGGMPAGNMVHPAAAWMLQQGQRPVLVSPLNAAHAPNDPNTLPLTPIGVNDGAHYINGFDDSPTRAQMALGPQDSVSAVTGRSSPRRSLRRRSDEQSEDRQRNMDMKDEIEEQIEEKTRLRALEEKRDRMESAKIDRDRKLIEQREEQQNEKELNKWKKLWETEQSREEKVLEALKKAEEESKLVRKAKLRRHADAGKENYDSMDGGLNGSTGFGYSEEDGASSALSKSIDAMERAREEAEQIARREQADRDEIKRQAEYKRAQAAKTKAKVDRSQSQPPAQYKSPMDSRPIKPQTEDPLQIWENYAQKLAVQRESESRLSRRQAPTRQSMRVKSQAKPAKDTKRADSLERLASKNEEDGDAEQQQNLQTPALSKTATNQVRPGTVVIARNTNGPPRPDANETLSSEPPGKHKARSRRTGTAAELLLVGSYTESPESSVTSKPPKSDRSSREKKRTSKKSSSPSRKLTQDTSPIRLTNGAVSPARGLSPQRTVPNGTVKNGTGPGGMPAVVAAAKSGKKLLKKRPSLDRMLQSGSDSEAVEKTTSDNPWENQLGEDNPLYRPIKTRRKKKSNKVGAAGSGDLSLLDSSLSTSANPNNQSSDSASLRSQTDEERSKPRIRSSSLLNLNTTAAAAKERSSRLRIERDQSVDSASTTSVRPTANINSFNARSPLHSSIRVKRDKPTAEKQQKILEQLSQLRQQLKDKQKQVETSFKNKSNITRE